MTRQGKREKCLYQILAYWKVHMALCDTHQIVLDKFLRSAGGPQAQLERAFYRILRGPPQTPTCPHRLELADGMHIEHSREPAYQVFMLFDTVQNVGYFRGISTANLSTSLPLVQRGCNSCNRQGEGKDVRVYRKNTLRH